MPWSFGIPTWSLIYNFFSFPNISSIITMYGKTFKVTWLPLLSRLGEIALYVLDQLQLVLKIKIKHWQCGLPQMCLSNLWVALHTHWTLSEPFPRISQWCLWHQQSYTSPATHRHGMPWISSPFPTLPSQQEVRSLLSHGPFPIYPCFSSHSCLQVLQTCFPAKDLLLTLYDLHFCVELTIFIIPT